MKSFTFLLGTAVLLTVSAATFAQKYKTSADTGKLNVEYAKVQNNIAGINAKLAANQSGLPAYQTKASNAGNTAQTASETSTASTNKAKSGNLQDSKDAKKSADNAYDKAKDAKSANNDVGKQNEKIRKLKEDLRQQRQRLKDLDAMRADIHAQVRKN